MRGKEDEEKEEKEEISNNTYDGIIAITARRYKLMRNRQLRSLLNLRFPGRNFSIGNIFLNRAVE